MVAGSAFAISTQSSHAQPIPLPKPIIVAKLPDLKLVQLSENGATATVEIKNR